MGVADAKEGWARGPRNTHGFRVSRVGRLTSTVMMAMDISPVCVCVCACVRACVCACAYIFLGPG